MGVSTNGQICYGIAVEEEHEFPWGAEKYDGEISAWWREVHGFKHSFELFGPDGNYLNGEKPSAEELSAYFAEERKFDEKHPVPVSLVNCCSCDYPQYILAVPRTCMTARRGYPQAFDPQTLSVSDEERAALLDFLGKYLPEINEEPQWWLSSLWC